MSMELEITDFVEQLESGLVDPSFYCDSIAHSGLSNIGQVTWNRALHAGHDLVTTEEQIQEAKDHFAEYGAWDDDEIESWSQKDVNALLVQDICADYKEYGADDDSSRLYRDADGKFYYYLGS